MSEDGAKGLARGWAPTFIGYAMQVSILQEESVSIDLSHTAGVFESCLPGFLQVWILRSF